MSTPGGGSSEAFQHRPVQIDGKEAVQDWGIAVETPVEIRVNGSPWTVMLATPADIEDLAVGLAITERLVTTPLAIHQAHITSGLGEFSVDLIIPPEELREGFHQVRALAGNTGCGLCGLESLAAFRNRLDADHGEPGPAIEITDHAVMTAFASLPDQQVINRETRSVHGAAWCSPDGAIMLVREDVGRHNALDKLIGARARSGQPDAAGFIAMTSRCSYELVYKAAAARALLLATISAPTTLALTWSETLGVPLACIGPGNSVVRFPQETIHAAG